MVFPRSSGILLHPTSLPGRYGIGDLGDWAYRFVDFLEDTHQKVWQMLPLGPTSYGDSPYQSLSTFAGNTLLISLDKLVTAGWLTPEDVANVPTFPDFKVDYGNVIPFHKEMLNRAFRRFKSRATPEQNTAFRTWCSEQAFWLDEFALFAALKEHHGGKAWVEWPEDEAMSVPEALENAMQLHAERIEENRFCQWLFFEQWFELKRYANAKNIRLIGDLPIFVAHDSADVWANRELFYLDEQGQPTVVAGVPPDYFSATGQRWGNPLYRWDVMASTEYDWWCQRVSATLKMVDVVRIDHFRGFEAYWEVPATEETAIKGRWVPAPSFTFFRILQSQLGEKLPIIAEDLGVITRGVEALRDELGLPGMKVLQFAWGDFSGTNAFLPHNHVVNSVVYTGTHDNNTTVGWWYSGEADNSIREHIARYVERHIDQPHWELIRLAMMSVAHTCVVPMQDVLGLGADARMNTPGVAGGNWTWRLMPYQFDQIDRGRLRWYTELYGRHKTAQPAGEVGVDMAVRRPVTNESSAPAQPAGDANANSAVEQRPAADETAPSSGS